MRNFILLLLCCFGLSLQLSAASDAVLPATDGTQPFELTLTLTAEVLPDALLTLAGEAVPDCSIVYVCTSCRDNCTRTQYCDGGFHGDSMEDWADTIEDQACGG